MEIKRVISWKDQLSRDLRKMQENELPQVCKDLGILSLTSFPSTGTFWSFTGGSQNLQSPCVMLSTHPMINWSGMLDIRHMDIRSWPVAGYFFIPIVLQKGISGFPKKIESEFDTFGCRPFVYFHFRKFGMAVASDWKVRMTRKHIAVIGDGAMTAGNGWAKRWIMPGRNSNLLVVLNDNCMTSIRMSVLSKNTLPTLPHHTLTMNEDEVWKLLFRKRSASSDRTRAEIRVEGWECCEQRYGSRNNLFESYTSAISVLWMDMM